MTEVARKTILHDHTGYKPKVAAINPCNLCPHKDYKQADPRCKKCELRGKRFFEIKHAVA